MSTVLSPEQGRALFEQESQSLADLPAEEFLAKWDAGEYRDLDDSPEGRKIACLALLIPFGRRHSRGIDRANQGLPVEK